MTFTYIGLDWSSADLQVSFTVAWQKKIESITINEQKIDLPV